MNIPQMLTEIRLRTGLSQESLARLLGTSFASISRWEIGTGAPSPAQATRIQRLYEAADSRTAGNWNADWEDTAFQSHGIRNRKLGRNLDNGKEVYLASEPRGSILAHLVKDIYFSPQGESLLHELLTAHDEPADTGDICPTTGISAGKNTYTYDAHTYHTKMPPQGITELIQHYLPGGGLVFDPFAGSGMTGVACNVAAYDCILNELSPAACFIANRFTTRIAPELFEAGVRVVLQELNPLRKSLYTTHCRECGKSTEILYTVWSYNVRCSHCAGEFLLWDHCRKYGKTVREHKILSEFPCPHCGKIVKKSALQRTTIHPVQIMYKCCGQAIMSHPLDEDDFARIRDIDASPPLADGFFPTTELRDGVNLRQPKKHGLTSIAKFYSSRNLAAMSHLWKTIHRIEDGELRAFLAFVFTSLYQRVTRLSEFRFWGGAETRLGSTCPSFLTKPTYS